MTREKFTTTLDTDLLNLARQKAAAEDLPGVNAILEKALRLYFANCSVEVWEKALQGGWFKKITIRNDRVILENIRSRKIRKKFQFSLLFFGFPYRQRLDADLENEKGLRRRLPSGTVFQCRKSLSYRRV